MPQGIEVAFDERVLGGDDFIERLLSETEEKERQTLRVSRKVPDLVTLAKKIVEEEGNRGDGATVRGTKERGSEGKESVLPVGDRKDGLSRRRSSGFLGVTTSPVNRLARGVAYEPRTFIERRNGS